MDKQNGTIFKVVGFVKSKWVSPAGKFAKVTVDVPRADGSGESQIDVRAFGKSGLIEEMNKLQQGQRVSFTGNVDKELLKSKDRKEVTVDGYKAWVERLTATKMEVEPVKQTAVGGLADDDKVGW